MEIFRSHVKLGANFFASVLSEDLENRHHWDSNQRPLNFFGFIQYKVVVLARLYYSCLGEEASRAGPGFLFFISGVEIFRSYYFISGVEIFRSYYFNSRMEIFRSYCVGSE